MKLHSIITPFLFIHVTGLLGKYKIFKHLKKVLYFSEISFTLVHIRK